MHEKKGKSLTSGVEIYIPFLQDQELPTKFLKNKRDRDSVENPSCSNKCRLCINNVGDISQIIAGCSQISAIYYLPLIHDEVVKTMLNSHLNNIFHDQQKTLFSDLAKNIRENTVEHFDKNCYQDTT